MKLDDIIYINSIPELESELKAIQENVFKSKTENELISLILKEMLIRVRIKQIEHIIHPSTPGENIFQRDLFP